MRGLGRPPPTPPRAVTQTFMLCWFFLLVFITFDIANNEP